MPGFPRFSTRLLKTYSQNKARSLRVTTAHGEFITPTFMPVGTRAFVNLMTPEQLKEVGSQIILGGNTYHMLCSPGLEILQSQGGMHCFMDWHGPMLTDSGGYQVFSLSKESKICKIDDEGARFKHPTTGKIIHLNPNSSIAAQKIIGADIIMAFDQCTPEQGGYEAAVKALERTHRWLLTAKEIHTKDPYSTYGYEQALFGIIQGGRFEQLREKSLEFVLKLDLQGIAIGGEVIGYDMATTLQILDFLESRLPQEKIRYTMGVGLHPQDLIEVVAKGVDIFDCVAPTRNARHGSLYCGEIADTKEWIKFESEHDRGRLLIKTACYAQDERPIMKNCTCYTCLHFSRAYLHFLFKQKTSLHKDD